MKFDEKKLARQKLGIDRIKQRLANPRNILKRDLLVPVRAAIFEAVTGFGKTLIPIMMIQDMNQRKPDRSTIIVVPNQNLYDDWMRTTQTLDGKGKVIKDFGHIKKHGLLNIRVFIVNTYTKYKNWKCDFLVLDEVHRYASKDAEFFSQVIDITDYRFGLGLTATLTPSQRVFLCEYGWDVVDTVTKAEAEREGYIVKSSVYNLAISLDEEAEEYNKTINKKFNDYFQLFRYNLDLMKACSSNKGIFSVNVKGDPTRGIQSFSARLSGEMWRKKWAAITHVDAKAIFISAIQGMRTMNNRRNMWQNYEGKLTYIKQLVDKFPHLKTIIFTESSEFADTIARMLGKTAVVYHTKLKTIAYREGEEPIHAPSKDQIKFCKQNGWTVKGPSTIRKEVTSLFEDPDSGVNQFVTVKAFDEGYDNAKVKATYHVAYNSTPRQSIQRSGRGDRIDYEDLDKKTLTVFMYMETTQEEKWLDSAQEEDTRAIIKVRSVDEINIDEKVVLYVQEDETVGAETGTIDDPDSGRSDAGSGGDDTPETSV